MKKDHGPFFYYILTAAFAVVVCISANIVLGFNGRHIDFIADIDENSVVTVTREITLLDENRISLGTDYTSYNLSGKNAVEFKEIFSSFRMRKLLRTKTQIKHREDFVYYRITIDDGTTEFQITTHGDYLVMPDHTILFCKLQSRNWRDKLNCVLDNSTVLESYTETPDQLK